MVLAIVSDPALRDEEALLSGALSNQGDFTLVERTQLEKILTERKLQATAMSSAEYAQTLKLLKADGLLLMQPTKANDKSKITLRLVSVNAGVVLAEEPFDPELFKLPGFETIIISRFRTAWPMLAEDFKNKTPVSMIGIFAPVDSIADKAKEREWTTRLAYRLAQEKGLVMLERKNLETLVKEKSFDAAGYMEFLTGRCLIDGQFTEAGSTVKIKLRVQFPGVNKTTEIEAEGETSNPSALTEDIIKKIMLVLKKQPERILWNASEEAKKYQTQAAWALNHGLFSEAQSAGEVAWALGTHNDELVELLLVSYCKAAFPSWGYYRTETGSQNNYFDYAKFITVNKDPNRLEFAIRAMEILWENLQKKPFTVQEYNFFEDSVATYTHHYDFRIQGARAVLNASRVLREFYDEKLLSKHEDRLIVLRQLLRDNASIIIDNGENDERLILLLEVQLVYAPYWYEYPKEVLNVYCNILKNKTNKGIQHLHWPEYHDQAGNVGYYEDRTLLNRWVISWNPAEKQKVELIWKDFLEGCLNSTNAEDRATYWMYIINSTKDIYEKQQGPAQEFIWKERPHFANEGEDALPWRSLLSLFYSWGGCSRDNAIRYFEYLMNQDILVRRQVLYSLLENIVNTEHERDNSRTLWNRYLARLRGKYSENELKAYLKSTDVRRAAEILADNYLTLKQNGGQALMSSKAAAQEYPKPASDALPVTRFWCAKTATCNTSDLRSFHHLDGKIYALQNFNGSSILEINLSDFKAHSEATPVKEYYTHTGLAVGQKHFWVASDTKVYQNERGTSKWTTLKLPPSKYSVSYIAPYCYLMFEDTASGLYRYDPRDEKIELLTSTRSRPPSSGLDEETNYHPKEIRQSKDGSLVFTVEFGNYGLSIIRKMFRSDPSGRNWKLLFQTQSNRDNKDMTVSNDPKGLLVHADNALGDRPYFYYYPDVMTAGNLEVIDMDRTCKIPGGTYQWKQPSSSKDRLMRNAVWHNGSLVLLTVRHTDLYERGICVDPILHVYPAGQTSSIDVPLDLQISDAEGKKILSPSGSESETEINAQITRLVTLPWLKCVDTLLSVAGGLLIYPNHGDCFWFLPDELLNQRIRAK